MYLFNSLHMIITGQEALTTHPHDSQVLKQTGNDLFAGFRLSKKL